MPITIKRIYYPLSGGPPVVEYTRDDDKKKPPKTYTISTNNAKFNSDAEKAMGNDKLKMELAFSSNGELRGHKLGVIGAAVLGGGKK